MKAILNAFIALFLLVLSAPVLAVSTGEIHGQIIEKETGKPIAFVVVTLENKMDKIEVTANEYGYYYAGHVPTGKYQLRVHFNNRDFVINQVRVYDNYTSKVNLQLSTDNALPATVILETEMPALQTMSAGNINLTGSSYNQPTRSLGEALSMEPGVEVNNGKLFIKGSDQVRFFIDGTPVMGNAVVGRTW